MTYTAGTRHRMPICFGPSPGPRQDIHGNRYDLTNAKSTASSLSFLTEAGLLSALLPPGFRLHGDPVITVTHTSLQNLAWLAGRGYCLLSITVPVVFESDGSKMQGLFMPVLWENMAEPILTGREELGFAKLYAELPPPAQSHQIRRYKAEWDKHCFFEMSLTNLKAKKPTQSAAGQNIFHHRYFPPVGQGGTAVNEITLSPAPSEAKQPTTFMEGDGDILFHKTTWEQMPTQFHIVNYLADLPVLKVMSTRYTETVGVDDAINQRVIKKYSE